MKRIHIETSGIHGIRSFVVSVETDIQRGLFNFDIIGLADKTVAESRLRILSALINSGFKSPKTSHHKIVTLLGPSGLKKEGSHFDLPVALSYLNVLTWQKSSSLVTPTPKGNLNEESAIRIAAFGELSLSGEIRKVSRIVQLMKTAQEAGCKNMIVPADNMNEAEKLQTDSVRIWHASSLAEAFAIGERIAGSGALALPRYEAKKQGRRDNKEDGQTRTYLIDSIQGLAVAKRALLVALSGKHHLMLCGTPGVGKSMIARSSAELLPELSDDQIISSESVSLLEGAADGTERMPPFREPHHTSSYVTLIGNSKRAGEASLAHNGILFLDEMAEIDRRALESLRQPLENKRITISDGGSSAILPADFILIGTMNPCRCGYHGSLSRKCTCPTLSVERYSDKISGPIADRIGMWVYLSERDSRDSLEKRNPETGGGLMRRQIEAVRRLKEKGHDPLPLSREASRRLEEALKGFSLSRRFEKLAVSISETIALLDGSNIITESHMLEALSYRKRGTERSRK